MPAVRGPPPTRVADSLDSPPSRDFAFTLLGPVGFAPPVGFDLVPPVTPESDRFDFVEEGAGEQQNNGTETEIPPADVSPGQPGVCNSWPGGPECYIGHCDGCGAVPGDTTTTDFSNCPATKTVNGTTYIRIAWSWTFCTYIPQP